MKSYRYIKVAIMPSKTTVDTLFNISLHIE